jgi:hypothetical protein
VIAEAAPPTSPLPGPPPYRRPALAIGLCTLGGVLVLGVGGGLGVAPAIGALLLVLFGMLVLARPAIGALTLVALTPILSGFKRGLPVPGLKLSEVLIVFAGALILLNANRDEQQRWRVFDWLALAYVVMTVALSAFDVLDRHLIVGNDTARAALSPIQYFLLYRAVLVGLPSERGRRRALQLILLVSIPESLLAIMQQFHIAGVRGFIPRLTGVNIDTTFGAEGGGTRATGTFPHWQVLAGYEFVVLAIGSCLFVDRRQQVLSRPLLALVLAFGFAAMFTTVTFTPLICAVLAAVALGAWYGRPARVAGQLALGAVIAATLFAPALVHRVDTQFSDPGGNRPFWLPQTVYYRYQVWTGQYFPALAGKWATGYGPDLPPSVQFPYTESLYMTLLLRGAIPLLAIYILMIIAMLGAAIRARNDPEPERRAAARTLAVITVLLIFMHAIEPYFILTGGSHLIWILAALAFSGRAVAAQAPQAAPAPPVGRLRQPEPVLV